MHNYKHPIYEIEVKAQGCPVTLQVNDMPCFSNYNQGAMAVDWPVNPNILSSGKQMFTLRANPYEGEGFIHKNAKLELRVYVRDAFDNPVPRVLLTQMPVVDFSEKEDSQIYVYAGNFDAEIPYHLEGWKSGVAVVDEDKEKLMKEIGSFYDELYEIFKTKDLNRYKELTKVRFEELTASFYMPGEMSKQREAQLIPSFTGEILRTPLAGYALNFYAEGNVVGAALPYKPSGFNFYSTDKEENTILELALFYRKKKGEKLRLIR